MVSDVPDLYELEKYMSKCGTKPIDLVGQRFGQLVAVESIGHKDTKRGIWWKCQCSCGDITYSTASDLRSGHKKSCGCKTNRLRSGEAIFNLLFSTYKKGAKNRGLAFGLTKEQFRRIVQKPCHYCGSLPTVKSKKKCYGEFMANGVDRIENNRGYDAGNVVACCSDCNYMKGKKSLLAFLQKIHKIVNHTRPVYGVPYVPKVG